MSNAQREAISYWTNVFMKAMMGISGAALLMLYSSIKDEAQQTREEFRKSIERIEITTEDTKTSVNSIQSKMNLLEYRLNRLDNEN